jgi:hypothetical protein
MFATIANRKHVNRTIVFLSSTFSMLVWKARSIGWLNDLVESTCFFKSALGFAASAKVSSDGK